MQGAASRRAAGGGAGTAGPRGQRAGTARAARGWRRRRRSRSAGAASPASSRTDLGGAGGPRSAAPRCRLTSGCGWHPQRHASARTDFGGAGGPRSAPPQRGLTLGVRVAPAAPRLRRGLRATRSVEARQGLPSWASPVTPVAPQTHLSRECPHLGASERGTEQRGKSRSSFKVCTPRGSPGAGDRPGRPSGGSGPAGGAALDGARWPRGARSAGLRPREGARLLLLECGVRQKPRQF